MQLLVTRNPVLGQKGRTYADTSVGSILDGRQERVIHRVKSHGESTVDDAAVDVGTEIDLHDITLLQHHLVASVGGVVGSAVVNAETTGETHTTLEVITFLKTLVTGQGTDGFFNALRDLGEGLTRLNGLLRILTNLTVHLSSLTVLLQEVILHAVEVALLLVGGAVRILILVLDDLTLGVFLSGEQSRQGNARRRGLDLGATLLLLLGLALLLFLGG